VCVCVCVCMCVCVYVFVQGRQSEIQPLAHWNSIGGKMTLTPPVSSPGIIFRSLSCIDLLFPQQKIACFTKTLFLFFNFMKLNDVAQLEFAEAEEYLCVHVYWCAYMCR
jgi:hypothetical protein